MDLSFEAGLADHYSSASQKIRVVSESWFARQAFCPSCGCDDLKQYANNRPVADFRCSSCREDFELKSMSGLLPRKIVDGAYGMMMQRLAALQSPNLALSSMDIRSQTVIDFLVVPRHFFTTEIIESRKPLSITARRAGWVGCNILLDAIPEAGRIFFVRNRSVVPRESVLASWRRTLFLREQTDLSATGWLVTVLRCIERVGKPVFQTDDVYAFADELRALYPNNRHIKEKMRQQLQVLRDEGLIEFTGKGQYRMT